MVWYCADFYEIICGLCGIIHTTGLYYDLYGIPYLVYLPRFGLIYGLFFIWLENIWLYDRRHMMYVIYGAYWLYGLYHGIMIYSWGISRWNLVMHLSSCIHTCIHTYIHTYIHKQIDRWIDRCIGAYLYIYINVYTYIHSLPRKTRFGLGESSAR